MARIPIPASNCLPANCVSVEGAAECQPWRVIVSNPTTLLAQSGFQPPVHPASLSTARARGSRAAAVALMVLVFCGSDSSLADQLYGFTDERGVFHFSDVASEPRYRRILDVRYANVPGGDAVKTKPRRAAGELSGMIHDAARQTGIEPALIEAIAFVESGFDERARSPKGALGLMQLMPATATRFGVADPLDPRQNLVGGARYLRELIDRFETLPLALAAYNAGEGAVERHANTIPPYSETVAYVPRVLKRFSLLRGRPLTGSSSLDARLQEPYAGSAPRSVSSR